MAEKLLEVKLEKYLKKKKKICIGTEKNTKKYI